MPHHKDLKRLVRARMAETGEKYTQALTALLSETPLAPLPAGWHMSGNRGPSTPRGCCRRDRGYDGKRAIQLRFRAAEPPGGFGTVMQSIDAERYRGRRVRFSAMIRGRGNRATGPACGCGSTRASGTKVLDNMQDRPLRGTTGWTEAANVLDVAEDAVSVHFGLLLAGAGAVNLARPRFEIVGTDVPVTPIARKPLAPEPQGLDFGAA